MIAFNVPYLSGNELRYIQDAYKRKEFSGNGYYTLQSEKFIEELTKTQKCLLTSSCSHALDICAILLNIQPGDEIIMASYNFVSAANSFASRGAKIRFVDIDPKSMNIDSTLIEGAINKNTKAVLAMHYGGVSCDLNSIKDITKKHGLFLIEDAAHCIGSYSNNQHLGTIGDIGTLSFHATKNIQCGEGGALLINNKSLIERAEIVREKGTNRSAFKKGVVDKYTWVDLGSSHLMSEISASFLYGQLMDIEKVRNRRKELFNNYHSSLLNFLDSKQLSPLTSESNNHLFYLKTDDRVSLISHLKNKKIQAFFHYIPLHSSTAGIKYSSFHGEDKHTTRESEKLLRLPLYYDLKQQSYILEAMTEYFS